MNHFFALLLFASFLFIGLFTGCTEKPASIGNGLTNTDGNFTIADTSFISVRDTSYRVTLTAGFGLSNLAGRISPAEEAITLIKFLPGTAISVLQGATIDTAEMRLTVNYRFFPQSPKVTFSVVEVLSSWSQESFSSDSLPMLMLGTKNVGEFSDSMSYTSVTRAMLDTLEIRKWANSFLDSSAARFYGFALQAPAGINTGIIGFSTFSNFTTFVPQLFIRYTKNGVRDSVTFFSGEDTYAAKYSGSSIFQPLTVRGGFGIRSKITFDLSSLQDKPIINSATLNLTMDTAASLLSGYSPDTVTALLGMSATDTDLSDSTIFVYGFKKAVSAGQPPVYSFNLTRLTDYWVRSVKPNYGLTLRWGAEYGTVEKAVFYSSSAANASTRPTLNIIYSKK